MPSPSPSSPLTIDAVVQLLRDDEMRGFRIDIETDSTIRMDEDAEKAARVELIETVSKFLTDMVQAGMQAPEILPMLGELLMWGIRSFKTARAVEQTFEDMMEALEKAANAPKGPPPEVQKIQAQAAVDEKLAHDDSPAM